MKDPIYLDVAWRHPFRVSQTNLLVEVYRAAFGDIAKPRTKFLRGHRGFRLYRKLGKLPVSFTVQASFIDGNRGEFLFPMNPRNSQFHSIFLKDSGGGYEPALSALLDRLLPDDGVFLDVGSNWGHMSLYAASRAGFRGEVHAFEPNPQSHQDLVAVVKATGLEGQIRTHGIALSSVASEASLEFEDPYHSGSARIALEKKGNILVSTNALDQMPEISRASFIKIDVEGHEPHVLLGARKILTESRPYVVFESCIDREPEGALATIGILESLGYQCYSMNWAFNIPSGPRIMQPAPCAEQTQARAGTLALNPISVETRFLYLPLLNLFACPVERIDELSGKSTPALGS